ncbi:unnamed protein product, partial [Polarella glacialis]
PLKSSSCLSVDTSSHEEDLEMLEFSLLQTSLKIERVDSQEVQVARGLSARAAAEAASKELPFFAAPASFVARRAGIHKSFLVELLSRHCDPQGQAGFAPVLLFTLIGIVMCVYVLQLLSVAFDEPAASGPKEKGCNQSPPPSAITLPPASRLSHGGGVFPPARSDSSTTSSQERPSIGHGPASLPPVSSVPSARHSLGPSTPSLGLPQTVASRRSVGQSSSAERPSQQARDAARPDAICPALILPHGEAQFLLPAEALRRLSRGPVEVLGPSGRPLLHARLQAAAGAPVPTQGMWLELSTTATSKYPHASVGPLVLGKALAAPGSLEVRGPRGDRYGLLQPSGRVAWQVLRNGGHLVLSMTLAEGGAGLVVAAASGKVIGSAMPTPEGEACCVKVSPGVDALLTLLSVLAVILTSPEVSGLRL